MDWITSNLKPLGAIGIAATLIAIFWPDGKQLLRGLLDRVQSMGWFRWLLLILGLGCTSLTVFGVYSVITSAPGGEETVVEIPDIIPAGGSTKSLADVLSDTWDANDAASWPVAEMMAEVSNIAYLAPYKAKPEFESLGFDSVHTLAAASMFGYVVTLGRVAVVVFRGTDDPGDWVANLKTSIVKTKHGPAHRGFYEAYQPLSFQVIDLIRQADAEHIWVTGHSLGGALAVLCAYDLSENEKLTIDGLITFGQPMVARGSLTNRIEELLSRRYVHYVNQRDVVARIPPSFQHCGSVVWYDGEDVRRSRRFPLMAAAPSQDDKDDVAIDAELTPLTEGEFAALQQQLKEEQSEPDYSEDGTPLMKGNLPFIKDHDMVLYLDRVHSAGSAPE